MNNYFTEENTQGFTEEKSEMKKVTVMHGNRRNGISGSRVTVWNDNGSIADRFVVPKYEAVKYCNAHPNGYYGKRFSAAMND